MNLYRITIFYTVLAASFAATASAVTVTSAAESFSVLEFVAAKDKWQKHIRNSTELTLSGRFAGRIGRQFRLSKLPIMIGPERTTALPSDVDHGERVTVTGKLRKVGPRYEFDASRIALGANDSVRLRRQIRDLSSDKFEDAYALANRYRVISEFYEDEVLQTLIMNLRATTFAKQRAAYNKDFQKLNDLVAKAKELGLNEDTQQNVRFESIVQMSKQKGVPTLDVLKRIRNELTGWDNSGHILDPQQQQAFQKDPIQTYEGLIDAQRPAYHRFFYRAVRLPEIVKSTSKNGSNADEVAAALKKELPEEAESIQQANTRYVAFRMAAVPKLTRRQLSELETLLVGLNRQKDFDNALSDWLKAQNKRLNNQQLDGLIDTADQYLFAFERWKNAKHGETGIQYMKRAWAIASGAAPEEAATIETRLEQLGWVRLRNEWMTTNDVAALPDSDMDLAMKEGRVVEGMKVAQVRAILGDPGRRVRVASKGKVQEVWVFGGGESSGITVHLARRSFDPPASAVVTKVARTRR